VPTTDATRVAERALRELPLATASLSDEYFYSSLTLCVLDAVFSIGVLYESTSGTVRRYCHAFGVPLLRADRATLPPRIEQEPLSALVERCNELGADAFATRVGNHQRTSPRNGVLKAEAVAQFAKTLRSFGVERFQDLQPMHSDEALDSALRSVRGQSSGIAVQYFWMLAGSEDLAKPDRMVLGFLSDALGRLVAMREATSLLQDAAAVLQREFPHITPRLLDHEVWRFQRGH
jgi:hypothetical protein